MCRRGKILASAMVVVLLVAIGWVALFGKRSVSVLSLTISTNGPRADLGFFAAFLTNNTGRSVMLYPLLVQMEEDYGMILNNMGENWVDTSGKQVFIMPPQSIAAVSPQADSSIRRLRVIAEYDYEASTIPRFISRGVRKLNPSFLPNSMHGWLASHGFVNGRAHGVLESSWMRNPKFEHTSRRRWEPWMPASNSVPDAATNVPASTNYGSNRARYAR